jgi:hypothetical protein
MNIPLTTVVLLLLTAALVMVRIFWLRVPPRLRVFLVRFACVSAVAQLLITGSTWSTGSNLVNAIINWLAIAGYMLLILLFTRLHPRWLTTISGIILLIPVFASSVVIPLGNVFTPTPNRPVYITRDIAFERIVWIEGPSSGIDFNIYRRPSWAPFLRHKLDYVPFNNHQCHTAAATAMLEPDNKNVRVTCPPWPDQNTEPVERIIRLH